MNNYLVDQNKFGLAGPPAWWLRLLWDFDQSLVVVPSRQTCVYRLAQRRKLNLPAHIVNDALFNQSDTQMLASYGLIPVTTIIPGASWNPFMFKELSDRAPWRNGGADKVVNQIEEREHRQEMLKREQTALNLKDRAKDGWKLYQAKTGQRTFIDSSKLQSATV